MKKDKDPGKDELRAEYKRSDFPGGLVRGKYAKRTKESSNVIVLRPEVAQAFSRTAQKTGFPVNPQFVALSVHDFRGVALVRAEIVLGENLKVALADPAGHKSHHPVGNAIPVHHLGICVAVTPSSSAFCSRAVPAFFIC